MGGDADMAEVVRVQPGDRIEVEPGGEMWLGPGTVIEALDEGGFVIMTPGQEIGHISLPEG